MSHRRVAFIDDVFIQCGQTSVPILFVIIFFPQSFREPLDRIGHAIDHPFRRTVSFRGPVKLAFGNSDGLPYPIWRIVFRELEWAVG
jgi:hypothetical protein